MARGGAAGCGAACRAVWALSAALPALSPAAAMGPASTALQGLMAAAEGRGPKAILLASCAALLLAQHPLAALAAPTAASTTPAAAAAAAATPASGGEAAAVEAAAAGEVAPRLAAAVRALSAWLLLGGTEGSEGLCRMAGAALRAVGRSAALGGAFMSGSPPLLQQLLLGLPASLQAPAAEPAVLDLHAALGATIGACAARGALDEHATTQALEAYP